VTAILEAPPTRRQNKRSRGYFGVAVWQPKTAVNVGTLWRQALLYDAAFISTIGRRYHHQASDTPGVPNHVPLLHYTDPLRATYLLGAEDHGIPPVVMDRCHHIVQIPSVRSWSMNVSVAGSIVMYDRFAKAGVTA